MESSPTMRSLGDVIAPLVKQKKSKPKSPNAVQELKNRRTEMANLERNNAANGMNGLNVPNSYMENPFQSPDVKRTTSTPLVLLDDNILKREELPPPRTKPLPEDIKILLTVLGTVGAVIFLLYIAKKIFYDKIHKNKVGKISHAYAHFRRFKKKGKSRSGHKAADGVETVCEVETKMSQSSESGLGTMNANEVVPNDNNQPSGSSSRSKCTMDLFHNVSYPPGKLQNGFKNIQQANGTQVPQRSNGLITNSRRYSSDSSSSDEQNYHKQRRRRRRRKRSSHTGRIPNERVIHQRATNGYAEHSHDNNCTYIVKGGRLDNDSKNNRNGRSTSRVEKGTRQVSCLSNEQIDSSGVFDKDQTRSTSSTWRDRAYS